jgi:hypothetical protein
VRKSTKQRLASLEAAQHSHPNNHDDPHRVTIERHTRQIKELQAVSKLKPLKAGDRVQWEEWHTTGTVVAVQGCDAWVDWDLDLSYLPYSRFSGSGPRPDRLCNVDTLIKIAPEPDPS